MVRDVWQNTLCTCIDKCSAIRKKEMEFQREGEAKNWDKIVHPMKLCDVDSVMDFFTTEVPLWGIRREFIKVTVTLFPGSGKMVRTPTGEIAGVAFGIPLDDETGHFTNLLVRKDSERRGIGSLLTKTTVEYLQERNVHSKAPSEVMGLYSKFGMKDEPYGVKTWRGHVELEAVEVNKSLNDVIIADMDAVNILNDVIPFCNSIFPIKDWWFLSRYIATLPNIPGVIAYKESSVVGYTLLFELNAISRNFVCTLHAESFDVALFLMTHLRREILKKDDVIYVTTYDDNSQAHQLVETLGLKFHHSQKCMNTKGPLTIRWENVFFTNSDCVFPI